MKFDCGPNYYERECIRTKKREAKIAKLEKPHKWFAWRPIRLGSHDCRWFEYVERQGSYHGTCMVEGHEFGNYWTWTYRAL